MAEPFGLWAQQTPALLFRRVVTMSDFRDVMYIRSPESLTRKFRLVHSLIPFFNSRVRDFVASPAFLFLFPFISIVDFGLVVISFPFPYSSTCIF
jgi:hypothetical protein